MSKWGTFKESISEVHVIPTDNEGYPLPFHITKVDCPCEPEMEDVEGFGKIYIHNQVQ